MNNPKPQFNMRTILETFLVICFFTLLASGLVSFAVICVHEHLQPDVSSEGFNTALKIFDFPAKAIGVALVVAATRVALMSFEAATLQNRFSQWSILQNDFITYVNSEKEIPVTALILDFKLGMRVPDKTDVVKPCKYLSPTTTLRRIHVAPGRSRGPGVEIVRLLRDQIDDVTSTYEKLRRQLEAGDWKWLPSLIDLSNHTRHLRTFLLLENATTIKFDKRNPLEKSQYFGENRLPPFDVCDISVARITTCLRSELLCIAHALFFFDLLQRQAKQFFDIGISVALIWSNANDDMKLVLENNSIVTLWIN